MVSFESSAENESSINYVSIRILDGKMKIVQSNLNSENDVSVQKIEKGSEYIYIIADGYRILISYKSEYVYISLKDKHVYVYTLKHAKIIGVEKGLGSINVTRIQKKVYDVIYSMTISREYPDIGCISVSSPPIGNSYINLIPSAIGDLPTVILYSTLAHIMHRYGLAGLEYLFIKHQ